MGGRKSRKKDRIGGSREGGSRRAFDWRTKGAKLTPQVARSARVRDIDSRLPLPPSLSYLYTRLPSNHGGGGGSCLPCFRFSPVYADGRFVTRLNEPHRAIQLFLAVHPSYLRIPLDSIIDNDRRTSDCFARIRSLTLFHHQLADL